MAFVRTTHTVEESAGSVEICVNLTLPGIETDILDEFILMRVINNPNSVYIPNNTVLASEIKSLPYSSTASSKTIFSLSAPDTPDFLGDYSMEDLTDYEEQIVGVNQIRNTEINAVMRLVCYDQVVYNDLRLEMSEYAGLTLEVREMESSVQTIVEPGYENAAIEILDDDSECYNE